MYKKQVSGKWLLGGAWDKQALMAVGMKELQ